MPFDVDAHPVFGLDGLANVLITGASSGIGLALVQQLLANKQVGRVVAVSRFATSNESLQRLQDASGERLLRMDADLTSEPNLANLGLQLQGLGALHLVINAAGLLHSPGLSPEKSIEKLNMASLQRVFALNAFAPVLLAKTLLPQLCCGQPAIFASLSARVGSIGDNRAGGWYAYRGSKAAQNQLLKTFSIEFKRRNPLGVCLMLHPGTVDTPLSLPFQANVPAEKLFDSERAAQQLLALIAHSTPDDNGRFIAWDGADIVW